MVSATLEIEHATQFFYSKVLLDARFEYMTQLNVDVDTALTYNYPGFEVSR